MAHKGRTYGRRAAGSKHHGKCHSGRTCGTCWSWRLHRSQAKDAKFAGVATQAITDYLEYGVRMEETHSLLHQIKMGFILV